MKHDLQPYTLLFQAYMELRAIERREQRVSVFNGEVVENRSEETGNHVKRVGEYSYLLAKKYGFDEETAELLRFASPMHDDLRFSIHASQCLLITIIV